MRNISDVIDNVLGRACFGALALLAAAILLPACDAYDENLVRVKKDGGEADGGDGGEADGGPFLNPDSGFDAAADDASTFDGEVEDGDFDAAEAPAPDCVPGDEDSCEWICPEVCDGEDNDCDGDTDEDPENEICDLPNAVAQCVTGNCVIDECVDDYDDCDNDDSTGCETSLTTLDDCGACGVECEGETCAGGICTVTSGCNEEGMADCDGDEDNGCETSVETTTDCGGCDVVCDLDNATESCSDGVCTLEECDSGYNDCDGDEDNGCETPRFGYTPSNFSATDISADPCSLSAVVLDCGTSTFDSQTLAYDNWCGQTEPAPMVRTQTGGPDVVIIALRGLTVDSGSTLRLIGDRPVILAVFGDANIEGSIDVSSDHYSTLGAGGNSPLCASSAGGAGTDDTSGDDGASGGGGGGFGSAGGHGGQGRDGATNTTGVGGDVGGNEEISPLRGGCRGGQGGRGWTSGDNDNARGGYGGGALQISVSGTLSVAATAVISAAGGGAERSAANDNDGDEDGGAGGGSGGALLLEARSVQMASDAWLTANGGGGSEGGDTWDASYCVGANGLKNSDDQAVSDSGGCGRSSGSGGDGGKGAAASGQATVGGDGGSFNGDAGGGGGGGVGRIRIRGADECDISANSSPAASTDCP